MTTKTRGRQASGESDNIKFVPDVGCPRATKYLKKQSECLACPFPDGCQLEALEKRRMSKP
jgi:hypothetical protein